MYTIRGARRKPQGVHSPDRMACHCRKVCHPLVGRSIACISIYAEPFFTELKVSIPKARIYVDRVLFAAFIDPAYEDVLERVAKRYFGIGIFWDEMAVVSLPGWDRVEAWWCPPAEPKPPKPDPNWDPETRARREHRSTAEPKRPSKKVRPKEHAKALEILGCKPTATFEEARKAYRKGCLERHPDRGGTIEAMVSWNQTWKIVEEMLGPKN